MLVPSRSVTRSLGPKEGEEERARLMKTRCQDSFHCGGFQMLVMSQTFPQTKLHSKP